MGTSIQGLGDNINKVKKNYLLWPETALATKM